jgi:small-conductance mechanosensitive channel
VLDQEPWVSMGAPPRVEDDPWATPAADASVTSGADAAPADAPAAAPAAAACETDFEPAKTSAAAPPPPPPPVTPPAAAAAAAAPSAAPQSAAAAAAPPAATPEVDSAPEASTAEIPWDAYFPESVFADSVYWEAGVDEVLSPEEAAAAEAERLQQIQARSASRSDGFRLADGMRPPRSQPAGGASGQRQSPAQPYALVLDPRGRANSDPSADDDAATEAAKRWLLRRLVPLALITSVFVGGTMAGMILAGNPAVTAKGASSGVLSPLLLAAMKHAEVAALNAAHTVLVTPALLQVATFVSLIIFTRQGLEPTLQWLYKQWQAAEPSKRRTWERSGLQWIFLDVYGPMEVVLVVAAASRLVEHFAAPLLGLPVANVMRFTHAAINLVLIVAVVRVLHSWQTRFFAELLFQAEMSGRVSTVSRIEGASRLTGIVTVVIASLFGARAVGFDLNNLLAVGGISGLAIGLAGREILGNVFMGLMLYATQPFSPGEHVKFTTPSQKLEIDGLVVDVGLFRTTVRSFEREMFLIPNSVFSTTILLNVTRKGREWRMEEFVMIRHAPLERLQVAMRDMRAVLKSEDRVLKTLHRRVFLHRIAQDGYEIIISCYVEAANRDQFMAVKEDLLQMLVLILSRNGLRLASNARLLEFSTTPAGGGAAAVAASLAKAVSDAASSAGDKGSKGKSGDKDKGKDKPPGLFNW